jgi:ABC-type oligopeptide transport system substrate-binding subunit
MRRFALLLLAAVSTCLGVNATAATRPHYGGTLRLAIWDAPASLDPGDSSQADSLFSRRLSRLIFDTLVVLDARGQPQPALASRWHVEPGNQRWQFSIRRGATFQDGGAVGPDAIAASLRSINPKWKVFASGEGVVIECSVPTANLPAILALSRNGIAKRAGGKLMGSGPFTISSWDPGKKLTLTARDDYWDGRVFLDAIEIQMGKSFREQMILLDLGKTDVVEVAPDQARHAVSEGRRVENSSPAELMALVFARDRQSVEDGKLRRALGLSIDRESMNTVLLQGGGEPAGALLPDWMTGYAFLFPTAVDMRRAQLTRGEVPQAPAWTLGYDASDPLGRVITERIVLNASDAGLRLQLTNSSTADVRLVRVPLNSLDARVAITNVAVRLSLPQPKVNDDSADSLYLAENALQQSQRVIPLLHLRTATALNPRVSDWTEGRIGDWRLDNVWLSKEKP